MISKYYFTDYILITRQRVPLKCKELADTRFVCVHHAYHIVSNMTNGHEVFTDVM